MSMEYIRKSYNVPAKRGMRVIANTEPGVITGSDGHYLRVRLDIMNRSLRYHPTWEITYLTKQEKITP
jgi:hypothetical protein